MKNSEIDVILADLYRISKKLLEVMEDDDSYEYLLAGIYARIIPESGIEL